MKHCYYLQLIRAKNPHLTFLHAANKVKTSLKIFNCRVHFRPEFQENLVNSRSPEAEKWRNCLNCDSSDLRDLHDLHNQCAKNILLGERPSGKGRELH
jgi:hypothetical protein